MNNKIQMYMHCQLCMLEEPEDVSMRDWARLNVGMTDTGLQVWCVRHDINVGALDFRGQKVDFQDEGLKTKKELSKLREALHVARDRYKEKVSSGRLVDDGTLAKIDKVLGERPAEAQAA